MPKFLILQSIFAAYFSLLVFNGAGHAALTQLARRVPSSANALVIINVRAAYASPLAKAQSWDPSGMQAHQGGMITLPEQAEEFLMAAEMDFEFMQPLWEIAVAYGRPMPTMEDIATRSGGRLDQFAGTQAVERPNDSFVVRLEPTVIGAMSPANRQQVNRWVRESRRRKSPELSPYLSEALPAANNPANHVVIALDLQGLLSPAEVAGKLAKQELFLEKKIDLKALSEVLASILGIRLEVQLLNPPQGRLSIDFEQDAEILGEFVKPLLMDALAKHGAGLDDIRGWEVSPLGKSIALEGELSRSGLRRVLSVLSSPVGPMAAEPDSSYSESGDVAMAEASQRYFQAVTNYLNDLFLSDGRPESFYQARIWVQRYADKIAHLEDYQVDKDVVAFGRDVVTSLDEIVNIVNRSETRSDLRESNTYASGRSRYGRYGDYGYFEKSYVTRDRQLIQADEADRSIRGTQVIVNELRELSARTRETMTERYKLPF